MGLAYTVHYLDLESDEWKQTSTNPATFESILDDNPLEVLDVSGRIHELRFKKGCRIKIIRVAGKYRISWDDESIL